MDSPFFDTILTLAIMLRLIIGVRALRFLFLYYLGSMRSLGLLSERGKMMASGQSKASFRFKVAEKCVSFKG